MPLNAGARLGPYAILAPIGAGGMGEVYRARDSKLDRDVAVKVLPPHLASDPDALARFEREAKAVAALSHPNILAIHDFGRDEPGGVSYAVMELLEGATLRDRLADGPLPPKKVAQVGADIARGLAAAHAHGIVHRDLKPENVFVTHDGRVKILDFGLAGPLPIAGGDANSATALRRTDPGTVLGTVGYMSPEQVKGQPADHRSDVFSLGCVLYELATGRRAFERETAAETMTAILREDPAETTAGGGAALPTGLESVIRHSLEKRPDERFQSARDLAFALQALSGLTGTSGSTPRSGVVLPAAGARFRRTPIGLVAGAVVLAAAAFGVGRFVAGGSSPGRGSVSFQQLTDDSGVEGDPAISPDGASVAFTSARRGSPDIFVQRVGGRNAILVAGDPKLREGAPAFSPDGAWIAFHDGSSTGGIFITGATGESARRVTDFGFHPAWSPDGQRLVFCTELIGLPQSRASTSGLWVVDAKGGAPVKLSDGDAVQAQWSPSGRQLAYWAVDTGQRDIFTMPSGGGPRVAITSDAAIDWNPQWSADGRYLYFASDRGGSMNIWRIPMDESSGRAAGPAEPVTAGVSTADQPSLSRDGHRLVFRSSETAVNPAAMAFDPVAETIGPMKLILDRTGSMMPTGISPDGNWLVLWNMLEHQEDVFIARTDGSEMRRLTDDAARDRYGVFSPDGKEIAFYSNRSNNYNVFAIRPDGSGLRALTESVGDNNKNFLYPTYSPSGDRLVASRSRSPESIVVDPRRPWKDQEPESIDMRMPDGSWLVPVAWSPDGRRWAGALSNSAGSSTGLGVYDVASRVLRRIFEANASSMSFKWLRDSRRILLSDPEGGRLAIVDVDTGRRRELANGLSLGLGLAVAPDQRTVYVSAWRRQADVWMATLGQAPPGR